MNMISLVPRWAIGLAAAMISTAASAKPVTLTLEGTVGNLKDFYAGGTNDDGITGPNLGIHFVNGNVMEDAEAGGWAGNFQNTPSGSAAMSPWFVNTITANVPAGFRKGFSVFAASEKEPVTVTVYSGLDGSGAVLGSVVIAPRAQCPASPEIEHGYFCHWTGAGVAFDGVAKSVTLTSADVSNIMYDNFSFGTAKPKAGGAFFTTFSAGWQPLTWTNSVVRSAHISGMQSEAVYDISHAAGTASPTPYLGDALVYSGVDDSAQKSFSYNRVFDVNIPVNADTTLSYWIDPSDAASAYAAVDLAFTDGTSLRTSGALDQRGVRVDPKAQGEAGLLVANRWNEVSSRIGQWVAGKTISRILVGYDRPAGTGPFLGHIDDIRITATYMD